MRRKRKSENGKVLAAFVVLLLFILAHPVMADDYVIIEEGTHDIDYTIGGFLAVTNDATVNLLPGAYIEGINAPPGDLYALDVSTINITGGVIDGSASIVPTSLVTIYGSGFELDGTPLDPNTTEIKNNETTYVLYQLSGTYEDSTAFTMAILLDPSAKISLNWPQPEPEIVVYPATLSHDFGDVPICESRTYVAQIMNIGNADLEVSSVTLDPLGSADFTITSAPNTPFIVVPSDTFVVDIEITFTPTTEGYVSTTLLIESNDEDEPLVEVELSGVGVIGEIPPEQQIQNILDFFDQSVSDGTLVGYGPGNSSEKRLNALRNMINAVGDLINAECYAQAIEQLESINKKTDGEKRPPDFVVGEATPILNQMVKDLIAALSCSC